MTLLISAITALIVGLSLIVNPAKIIKDVQAKTETNSNVTLNTTANGSSDTNNGTTNADVEIETDEKLETNITSNVTRDLDDELGIKDENHVKAEGQERVSVENKQSGKHMPTLIPKVAVDHSDSLEEYGNISLGTDN